MHSLTRPRCESIVIPAAVSRGPSRCLQLPSRSRSASAVNWCNCAEPRPRPPVCGSRPVGADNRATFVDIFFMHSLWSQEA